MSTSLKSTLTGLATAFASNVLDAIRQMSLDELLAETQGSRRGGAQLGVAARTGAVRGARVKGGRLGRRSAGDISALVDRIVSILQASSGGLRAEQIRAELGLEAKELPRPLGEALESGRISKTGQKRATTYFAKSGKAGKATKASKASESGGAGGKSTARSGRASRKKRGAAKKRAGKAGGKGGRKGGKRAASASQQHAMTNGASS